MTMRRTILVCALLPLLLGCPPSGTVQLGAVLPLSGEAAVYGKPIQRGVELAFETLKAQTDYPYELDLQVRDSGSDPTQAREHLSELFDGGALAAVGGVTTAEALEMVAVADQYSRVLVSPSASTPELTGISKYFYRVFVSDAREGTEMGRYAAQNLEAESVVILAKSDAYAKGIQEVFKNEFERFGGEVMDLIEFPAGSSDFAGLIDRVMTLQPDAVYLAAYANDIAAMIRALGNRGYEGLIFTTSAFAAPEVIAQVGALAEGVFLTQAVFDIDSDHEEIKSFVEAYRTKYGLAPDLYAAHGYDAMMVLAEAVRKGGGTTPNDVWKGIRSIQDFPGATGAVQFDEKGDAQKFPRVYQVNEGELVDYEKKRKDRMAELKRRLEEIRKRQAQRTAGEN